MARSYGKILASLVTDDDFNSLPADAQALYFRLLGHPKLTLVGSLDYRPAHLLRLASSWETTADVEAVVECLEEQLYIVVDRATEELLVRTLMLHDGIPTKNERLRKGLWAAWHGLASAELRQVAVEHMPPDLFLHGDAPDAAVRMRWSEPVEHPQVYPKLHPTEQVQLSPATNHLSPSASGQSDRRLDPQVVETGKAGVGMVRQAFQRPREEVSTNGN